MPPALEFSFLIRAKMRQGDGWVFHYYLTPDFLEGQINNLVSSWWLQNFFLGFQHE
jgi:hypothetical protein